MDDDLMALLGLDSAPPSPVDALPRRVVTADALAPLTAIVTGAQLADLLNLTPQQIGNLKRGGTLAPTGEPANPSYKLRESIRGNVASLRSRRTPQSADLQAEKTRQAREAADKLALSNAVTRGKLVPAAEIEAGWADTLRQVKGAIPAVCARVQARCPSLTALDVPAIDREVRDALTEAS